MEKIHFEWDPEKNTQNIRKHGISFEEARSAFHDENARFQHDPDHSHKEDRFILLGYTTQAKLLTIILCYRENNEIIRIISARKANRLETAQYHFFNR